MRGVVATPIVRARVVHTAFRQLADGVPYLEVRFQRLDGMAAVPPAATPRPSTPLRARYWLTPGALAATQRGLAAVGLALDLDAEDRWACAHLHGPSWTFDLPLVEVECPPDETHGAPDVVRTFVAHPARTGAP
jgi:hypothetical protein